MGLIRAGMKPATQRRIRLSLQWLVFQDQVGNFVLVDPGRNKPTWLDETRRPPSIWVAATDVEMRRALEEMLLCYQRATHVTSEHVELVDKVEAILEERFRTDNSAKRAA